MFFAYSKVGYRPYKYNRPIFSNIEVDKNAHEEAGNTIYDKSKKYNVLQKQEMHF